MKKYRYNIVGLDCANCAREIEEELKKDKRFNNVVVNFSTLKLSYESSEEISLKELNKIVRRKEEEVTITSDDEVKESKEYHLWILFVGFSLGIIGTLLDVSYPVSQILIFLSYVFLLYRPFINAINMLIKSRTLNENLLITISCVGAYVIGENLEGIMVISLYILGKILEEKAVNNTRHSIKNLLDIKQDYANIKDGKSLKKISVEEIRENDVIVVKKGERIPVDGIILKGETILDYSMLTGEQEPVKKEVNDEVLSGVINLKNLIEVKVTKEFQDSTVSKILSLVEDASDKKAKTETLVSRLSKIYTPTVLILAVFVAIFLPLFTSLGYDESIYRALTFLVISCPCAIAISVPLSYFTGIGVSSKNGILIKGSNYLDNLSHIKKIVFDKTGTITTGTFEVTKIEIFDDKYTREDIIKILIKGEVNSTHPIASSILKLSKEKVDTNDVSDYKELDGMGITYKVGSDLIKIGNVKLCDCENDAVLHLNINNKHIASITIDDGIKKDAQESIEELKKYNIKTYMFTGDKKNIAMAIGKKLGIDEVKYEMLPTDKYSAYENIKEESDIVAFVGDGINDAPTLKRADIGISMGSLGSNSAIEASDIVLMKDELRKIPLSIKISKYTNYIIKENLIFAIGVKLIILLLSVFGVATMWFAVFSDTGVTLITILNTLRIMNKFKTK